MKYITISAVFDDMDTAEAAARNLTHHISGLKSVKLHSYRQQHMDPDRYSSLDLTASTNFGYTNVAPGVIPPQGASPMMTLYNLNRRSNLSYTDRKVKMTAVIPSDKSAVVTSNILNSGGHFVKSLKRE